VIIPGSEVMAILALATGFGDLERRLGEIIVGLTTRKGDTGERSQSAGSMTLLLKDALKPNLVQTLEGARPGALRAVRQHRPWLQLGDGDAAGLRPRRHRATGGGIRRGPRRGKFFRHQMPHGGPRAEAAIVVATVRALKMHGGVKKEALGRPNISAVQLGAENLVRHVRNVKNRRACVVALNRFMGDGDTEIDAVRAALRTGRRR